MIATVQQASGLWCPHAMRPTGAGLVANHWTGSNQKAEYPGCMGDKCMQWRWYDPKVAPGAGPTGADRRGYCGLAGRPAVE